MTGSKPWLIICSLCRKLLEGEFNVFDSACSCCNSIIKSTCPSSQSDIFCVALQKLMKCRCQWRVHWLHTIWKMLECHINIDLPHHTIWMSLQSIVHILCPLFQLFLCCQKLHKYAEYNSRVIRNCMDLWYVIGSLVGSLTKTKMVQYLWAWKPETEKQPDRNMQSVFSRRVLEWAVDLVTTGEQVKAIVYFDCSYCLSMQMVRFGQGSFHCCWHW